MNKCSLSLATCHDAHVNRTLDQSQSSGTYIPLFLEVIVTIRRHYDEDRQAGMRQSRVLLQWTCKIQHYANYVQYIIMLVLSRRHPRRTFGIIVVISDSVERADT